MTRIAPLGFALARTLAIVALAVSLWAGFIWNVMAASPVNVSQKERTFQPGRLEIAKGDLVRLHNDDDELIHHAYIASDGFDFDSGEQGAGSVTDVRFTRAGTFSVRCRVHPRMLLVVTVK